MTLHLQKWGNSLGLRVPAQYIKQLNLHETDPLEMLLDVDKKSLIIRKKRIVKHKKHDLMTLLSKVTPDNIHGEAWEEDAPQGREIW